MPGGFDGFKCIICGTEWDYFPDVRDGREDPTCFSCGSSVRMRSLIYFLCMGLLGHAEALPNLRSRIDLVGIGLSDWEGYASWLQRIFRYTNTFYHKEPFLNIVEPAPMYIGKNDFVISSDVFEHVPPPVSRAFTGCYALLKNGGLLILTVPFAGAESTIEHYPRLMDFRIVQFNDDYVLVNRTDSGSYELHTDLTFHGGPGSTLEMRIFSLPDTVRLLRSAGFVDIQVHDETVPEWGVRPPHPWGLPITARKPAR